MLARARIQTLAVLLLSGVALSACGTTAMHPKLSNRAPDTYTPPPKQAAGNQPTGKGGHYKVGKPYQVAGIWYVPKEDPTYDATGVASWYGQDFHSKPTANGETFDMYTVSAAHTTLPMPSMVEVTNLDNGKKIMARVNDRGPFVGGRIIDMSYAAAQQLEFDRKGLANVRVRYVGPASLGVGEGQRYASAASPAPAPIAPVTTTAVAAAPLAPPMVVTRSLPPPATTQYAAASPYGAAPSNYAPTARADYRPPAATTYPPYTPPAAATSVSSSTYRVQAGAFSDPDRAQEIADQLAGVGKARVESVQRDSGTVYRVILSASADEGEAWALRDRVAAYGYADARVLRPSS